MMHSYIKSDRTYTVGLWLPTGDQRGAVFSRLFDVSTRMEACAAVSYMNGGDYQAFGVTNEH